MQDQVMRVAEPTPSVEGELRSLLAGHGAAAPPDAELFAVFDREGHVKGVALATEEGEDCVLHLVVVRAGSRGKGTGSALVNHLLGFFSDRCKRIFAVPGDAAAFFERFGFAHASWDAVPDGVRLAAGEAAGGLLVLELARSWSMGASTDGED